MSTEPTNRLEIRMARLEGLYEQINLRLSSLEIDLNRLEDKMDFRFDVLERKVSSAFDKLDRKIEARFSIITLLGAILVVLQVLVAS